MKDMDCPFDEFEESTYLKLNPDVLEAVQKKLVLSGWQHYIFYGYSEDRAGVPQTVRHRVRELLEDSFPPPPTHLRARVHGGEDLRSFQNTGKVVSFNVEAALGLASVKLREHSRILDFGCGCGRVLRWFHNFYKDGDFYGTDIDEEAIAWCQQTLSPLGKFSINGIWPPLTFSNEFFDFVYSISIFTHLPEDMEIAWLKELQRVTKKGGYLLLSTSGEELFQGALAGAKKQLQERGFYYLRIDSTEGLPEFYQTSYHTEKYISHQWSNFFETKIIKKGINNHQDLIICRRVK